MGERTLLSAIERTGELPDEAEANGSRGWEGLAEWTGGLGALPLTVEPEGDGWPEEIANAPLARLTAGAVHPREEA